MPAMSLPHRVSLRELPTAMFVMLRPGCLDGTLTKVARYERA